MNYQKLVQKIGMDKVAHFFASAFLVLTIGKFLHFGIVAIIVLAIGFIKELSDSKIDWRDLIADLLGIILGTFINII